MGKLADWINRRVDWSLDSASKKAGFVLIVLGEGAIAALLIYVVFFR